MTMHKQMPKLESADLILREVAHGKGVFAGRKFDKGEALLEFSGDLCAADELPFPYDEAEDRWLQVGVNLYIGPTGDWDDFVNHSCDPNAAVIINADRQTDRKILLAAIRQINMGEEISFDYSITMVNDDWEMACLCSSSNCRKRVREFKYLPEDVKQRYIGLGIVPDYVLRKQADASNRL